MTTPISFAGDGGLTAQMFQRAIPMSHATFYRELHKPDTLLRVVKVGKRTIVPKAVARAYWDHVCAGEWPNAT